ncbi:MAG: WD40/YVTN/BNR-like repeat-containing protein [Terriglobales bacterium]
MRSFVRLAAALLFASIAFAQTSTAPVDPSLYSGLRWRLLGPFRAGRITSVTGVPSEPAIYYVGTPDGGVWKTADGGRVWKPTMDSLPVSSIGAVAVAPSNPNVIYAGTGEESIGDGMYKSTDAGATWTNIGLKETKYIGGIVVDPKNADIVTVAASGPMTSSQDRGVYRTTDGGRTWKRVLFLDDLTGAIDLNATPDGRDMLVSLTRRPSPPAQQRPMPAPAGQKDSGPDSQIYRSTDGGVKWAAVGASGLPADQRGRVGVALAAGGKRMFIIMDPGLFRSDDGGNTWKQITNDPRIIGSSYFSKVFVNPQNADEVYVAQTSMYRSRDGGVHFESWNGAPSGDDVHTLWINPANPRHMILGIDQGAIISMDAGATWTEWFNQATGQFYHVTTDDQFPYHAFAAQQDSGSIATLSRSNYGEITYRDWYSPSAFEVAHILADPLDPNFIYASGWYDTLIRLDRSTGQFKHVFVPGAQYRSATAPPIAFVPQSPGTLLLGADKVMETTDRGETWRPISPDLTRGVPKPGQRGAGRPVLTAISPSPTKQGVIWAGSGDGLIHVTSDGGETWENVTPTKDNSDLNLDQQQEQGGLPASVFTPGGVATLETSHFDAGTAYAVYQMFRNQAPLIVRTHDFGQHWKMIAGRLPQAMAWAVREDTVRKGMLYAAVGHGMFVSFDDGDHWQSLQLNLPTTEMRDIAVRGNDVLVATYGRALWVLDDVSSLRQLGPEVAASAAHLFQPAPALRVRWDMNDDTPLPPETPAAANPPDGAIIDYYLKSPAKEISLEIHDANGQLVRKFTTTPEPAPAQPANAPEYWFTNGPVLSHVAGLNRFVWDLRYPHPEILTYGYFGAHLDYFEYTLPDHAIPEETPRWQPQGPLVAPGKYEVVLNVDGKTFRAPLEVKPDPRVHATQAGYEAELALEQRVDRGMAATYDAWNQVHAAHVALQQLKLANAEAIEKQLAAFEDGTRGQPGFGPLNRDLGRYAQMAATADGQPAQLLESAVTAECAELDKALARWKDFNEKELTQFNAQQQGPKPLPVVTSVPSGCGQ